MAPARAAIPILLCALLIGLAAGGCSEQGSGQESGGAEPAIVAAGGSGGGGGARAMPTSEIPDPPASHPGDGVATNVQGVTRLFFPTGPDDVFRHARAVDGLSFSDPNDPSHCKLQPGGKRKDVVVDGPNGRDNSFGKNVWPILLAFAPDLQATIDDGFTRGASTWLLRVDGLGLANSYLPLSAEVLPARGRRDAEGNRIPPTDWSTYAWEPFADYVDGVGVGDMLHSRVRLPASYLVDGVWVSGPPTTLPLDLHLGGQWLRLTIHRAVVTHTYTDDRAAATGGVISGILDSKELAIALKGVASRLSPHACDDWNVQDSLFRPGVAADVMLDGTQRDATCDGISIGIGFEAKQTLVGDAGPPLPAPVGCNVPAP